MISPTLLALLVCPENKTSLREADAAMIDRINAAIAVGELRNQAGEAITEPIEGGLIREDGTRLYVIRDDIPVMLIDEAIPLEQLT